MLSENTLLWLKERTGLNMLECCLSSLVSADSLSPAFCLKESFFLYNIAKYFSLTLNFIVSYSLCACNFAIAFLKSNCSFLMDDILNLFLFAVSLA